MVRLTNGKIVKPPTYQSLCVGFIPGTTIQYHVVKFALAHGWIPHRVDHRDYDRLHNTLGNLRPATQQQNAWNKPGKKRRHNLPRGVHPSGKRFYAMVYVEGKGKPMGSYATPAEASAVVEAFNKEYHGEFYHADPSQP